MADDLNKPYEYPFEMPSESAVKFSDGAIEGKPPGVPSSYARGGSTRWTPEAIAEVHALSQLGRYQVRGFNTFNNVSELTAYISKKPIKNGNILIKGSRGIQLEKVLEFL